MQCPSLGLRDSVRCPTAGAPALRHFRLRSSPLLDRGQPAARSRLRHLAASQQDDSSPSKPSSDARSTQPQPPQEPSTAPSTSATTKSETNRENSKSQPARSFFGALTTLLPPAAALQLIRRAAALLKAYFWPVVLTYMAKDCAAFLLHRVSQRLTNMTSDALVGTNVCTTANPWWLYLDSSFLESNIGYQACIVLFFVLALPLNIFLSSAAAAIVAYITQKPAQSQPAMAAAAAAAGTSTASPAAGSQPASSQFAASTATQPAEASNQQSPSGSVGSSTYVQSSTDTSTTGSTISSTKGSENSHTSNSTTAATGSTGSQTSSTSSSVTGSTNGSVSDTASTGSTTGDSAAAGQVASSSSSTVKKPGLIASIRQGLRDVRSTIPLLRTNIKRIWWVDILFNVRALPLQALSLLVLPLFWTVPRLLAIQLSVQAATIEGKVGQDALSRSQQLMKSTQELMSAYGWPFVALILAVRLLDGIRNVTLTALPMRWWQDVVEIPVLLTALFAFAKLLIIRMQDLLPLAAYLIAVEREAGSHDKDDTPTGPLTLPPPPHAVPTV